MPHFARCSHRTAGARWAYWRQPMEIRQRNLGQLVCLDLVGKLVEAGQDSGLQDKVNSLLFQGYTNILLNLEGVSLIDVSGLATMTAVKLAAFRQGADVKLLNLSARSRNMLVVAKLITLFDE